ncbi:MAG TPA: YiiD C-terminal domain-containing protein [Dokdonella sp.]|uniref:YiiD C-terminal domain-containing protein n=1 Tax=Dokdonella sp. TaxID=2291710 RepID=UPI002D7EFCBF|nr:YiiD C-terminal domain-containing protein [Dokdonella sp.]HET9034198.1 YiiD C-terminal domain-containing protein [Dokdonella sp.]
MNARLIEQGIAPTKRDALRQGVEDQLLLDIPMARAMQLGISAWDGESLCMSAPLIPNVNDKGCAFGGSLASVMTLACWSLIKLAAEQAGEACDIYVQDSTVRYLSPVWNDFDAQSRLAADQSWQAFFSALHSRGKARLRAECEIHLADGTVAASLSARFVALRPGSLSGVAG